MATIDQLANTDDFDWWQHCIFSVVEPATIEFSGLTFPATVFLDGQPVAECESMFLPLSIECGAGQHELVIHFGSLNHWLKARRPRGRWRSTLVSSPGLRWARTTLIGRAPIYGDLPAPVGVWRPIRVGPARLRTEMIIAADAASGRVIVSGCTAGDVVRLVLYGPDDDILIDRTATSDIGEFRFDATIEDPKLWWPNGYGPQHQYLAIIEVDGVQVTERRFGFRALAVTDDTSGFRLAINGTDIFCRGATWSPPDPVRMHVSTDEIHAQARAFAAAGANMIRVIGGLTYEQDEFWQACADAGLMVWQDAMLATFDPPAEQGELITRELTAVLRSVSGNPALTVISGGSETLQQPEMLGLSAQEAAMEVIDSLLPATVSEHSDAHYVRASPAPPPGSAHLAIRPDTGVAHWFGVGGYLRPIADVRSAGVKFAAECLAFANPPSSAFIDRHFGSPAIAGHHPDWKTGVPRDRGSSWDFEDIRDFYARNVFGEELLAVRRTDPARYLQLGRLAIAEAMRECFAFWRRSDSGCGGAMVLSARDMWPGAGWGLLDSDGNAKAALAVLARTWSPVSVILSDDGLSGIRIDVHNDSPYVRQGELSLVATSSLGTAVDTTCRVTVPPGSSVTVYDAEVSGHFRDLSHAFRFGPPTADAVQATVRFDDGLVTRDVLVVNPSGDQVASLVRTELTRQSDDCWQLQLIAEVALRYVELDIPGWSPADNYFHVAPRTPYTVALLRFGERQTPLGTVASIDLVGTVTVQGSR
ncbi:hypothetical protein [Mycobacterium sp. MAA66]|uniref:hypothetical protein n=1 Tax=Mycobacterium sp. MAA66 TaxID=3156297 RepID=UPI0035139A45